MGTRGGMVHSFSGTGSIHITVLGSRFWVWFSSFMLQRGGHVLMSTCFSFIWQNKLTNVCLNKSMTYKRNINTSSLSNLN